MTKVEGFYSVAGELLPPGGEQKYTHRNLQYVQTQEVRLVTDPFKMFIRILTHFPHLTLFPSLHFLFSLTKVNLTLDVLDEWSVERQPQWLTIHWSFLLQRAEVTLSHNPLQKEHLK